MPTPIGIDLGTTNSVVAYRHPNGQPSVIRNRDGQNTTPSVVAFNDLGEILVGEEALQTYGYGFCPGAELFKRQMGSGDVVLTHDGVEYTPELLSSLVITQLLDDAEAHLGERPTHAVVTVPAYFENPEREATLRAIEMSGLQCLQLINEPTAAAIAFRMDDESARQRVLVYDLGGGTFDVTILETGTESRVLITRGDYHLGGTDWDQKLAAALVEGASDELDVDADMDPAFQMQLRRVAEKLKKDLSVLPESRAGISHNGITVEVAIDRAEFESLTSSLLLSTIRLTKDAVDGASLGTSQIDEVLLVGGSTRMPSVSEALTELFGRPPLKILHPDEAVAIGAALKADALSIESGLEAMAPRTEGRGDDIVARINDITNHSLGMIAIAEAGDCYVNQILISRSSPLPAWQSQPFSHTFQENREDALEVFVTQGESVDPQSVSYLGRYVLPSLPGAMASTRCEIEVGFGYDLSGVVGVKARQAGCEDWTELACESVMYDVPERFSEAPPQPSRSLEVLLFFDVSYSMEGEPMAKARKAAIAFLRNMDLKTTQVGIGVVADESRVMLAPSSNEKEIAAAIQRIDTACEGVGGCNAGHPFTDIQATLVDRGGMRAAIVLADGAWAAPEVAITAAEACRADGIEIVGIGFGAAQEDFLDAISSTRDLKILTSEDGLTEAFTTIARVINDRAGLTRG